MNFPHPATRRITAWLATLALPWLAITPACADSVTVIDISRSETAQVEQLKRLPRAAWWLEMGDQLVVVGPGDAVQGKVAGSSIVAQFAHVDPHRLLLRARGCSEHSPEAGSLLARGGRWELRQVATHEMQPLLQDDHGAWQAVPRNSALARQYRLVAHGKAAASDPQVQQVVDRITPSRWFGDVQTLSGWDRSSYGTTSLDAARDWIQAQFGALGLISGLEAFNMNGPTGGSITRHNVAGAWIGSSQPERWVIVGAHYDSRNISITSTVNAPGAEDNASGCAGVIEVARALLPSQPSRSMLFMCYAGEEQGLRGSNAHVQSLIQSGELANVDAVVIMDMIGYSASANLEALYESASSHSAFLMRFGAAAATYVPALSVVTSTNPFGSDHVPYLNAGVQTVLAIENDWDIYPHYHRSTDLPANMGPNAQAMGGAILKTNAAVLADLAGLPPPVADLAISTTNGTTDSTPGLTTTYTIVASNAGPGDVTGAAVGDTFAAILACTWTCSGADGGTCSPSGSGVISDTVDLPVGASVTYSAACDIDPSASGVLDNTATISSAVDDPVPGNNANTDRDALTPQADLGITKSDGVSAVYDGQTTVYVVSVVNAGPSNAVNVSLSDVLPASLVDASWACNAGASGIPCPQPDTGSGNLEVTFNLPTTAMLQYDLMATTAGGLDDTVQNTATLTQQAGSVDPVPTNNSATDSNSIVPTGIFVDGFEN